MMSSIANEILRRVFLALLRLSRRLLRLLVGVVGRTPIAMFSIVLVDMFRVTYSTGGERGREKERGGGGREGRIEGEGNIK